MSYYVRKDDSILLEFRPLTGTLEIIIQVPGLMEKFLYLKPEEYQTLRSAIQHADKNLLEEYRVTNTLALASPKEAAIQDKVTEQWDAIKTAKDREKVLLDRLEGGIL